jgi:hypothetical protein
MRSVAFSGFLLLFLSDFLLIACIGSGSGVLGIDEPAVVAK